MTTTPAHFFLKAMIGCLALVFACGGGSGGGQAPAPATVEKGLIIFFGDSLTDGYTLPREQAYPALIQQKITVENLSFVVKNAGVSGDTSADGLRRIDRELADPVAVFVLALGVNDAGDDLPASVVEQNLQQILSRVKTAFPNVKLVVAGVDLPVIMSRQQNQEYQAMYQRLAVNNEALLIPNFLSGLASNPAFNLSDSIHPNSAGYRVIADTVWANLKTIL